MLIMLSRKTVRTRFMSVIQDFSEIFEITKKDLILNEIIIHRTIILCTANSLRIRVLMIARVMGGILRVNKLI